MPQLPIKINSVSRKRLYTPNNKLANTCTNVCLYIAGQFSSVGTHTVNMSVATYAINHWDFEDTNFWSIEDPTSTHYSQGLSNAPLQNTHSMEIWLGKLYAFSDIHFTTPGDSTIPGHDVDSHVNYWNPATNKWVLEDQTQHTGTSWIPFGVAGQHLSVSNIWDTILFDDGTGEALYLAGTLIPWYDDGTGSVPPGSQAALSYTLLRSYNGIDWQRLPIENEATVTDINASGWQGATLTALVFTIWNGELYVGGRLEKGVARWDPQQGMFVYGSDAGLTGPAGTWVNHEVVALSGNSVFLYAVGYFFRAGGLVTNQVARGAGYADLTWEPIPDSLTIDFRSGNWAHTSFVLTHDWGTGYGGSEPVVLFGGVTSPLFGGNRRILEFNEDTETWQEIGPSFSGSAPFGSTDAVQFNTAITYNNDVVIGGTFGYTSLKNITGAKIRILFHSNSSPTEEWFWDRLGTSPDEANAIVYDVKRASVFGGDGILVAGGEFTNIGGALVNRVAAYLNSTKQWVPMGSSSDPNPIPNDVYTIEFDKQSASITVAGKTKLMRWQDSTQEWFDTGSVTLGVGSVVNKLYSPTNSIAGMSGTLFIGGQIASAQIAGAGFGTVNSIVVRDGDAFPAPEGNLRALGGGVETFAGIPGIVNTIIEYYDPIFQYYTILIGGAFDRDGSNISGHRVYNNIARLKAASPNANPPGFGSGPGGANGADAWSPILILPPNDFNFANALPGVNGTVSSIITSGNSTDIYVFGSFAGPTAGGQFANLMKLIYVGEAFAGTSESAPVYAATSIGGDIETINPQPPVQAGVGSHPSHQISFPFNIGAFDALPRLAGQAEPSPDGNRAIFWLDPAGTARNTDINTEKFFGDVKNINFIDGSGPDINTPLNHPSISDAVGILVACGNMQTAGDIIKEPNQSIVKLKKDLAVIPNEYFVEHFAGGIGPHVFDDPGPASGGGYPAETVYKLSLARLPADITLEPDTLQLLISGNFSIVSDKYSYSVAELTPSGYRSLNEGLLAAHGIPYYVSSIVEAPPGFLGHQKAIIFGGEMHLAINNLKSDDVVKVDHAAIWDGMNWYDLRNKNLAIPKGPPLTFFTDTSSPPLTQHVTRLQFINGELIATDGAIGFPNGRYVAKFDVNLNGWVPVNPNLNFPPTEAFMSHSATNGTDIFMVGQGFNLNNDPTPLSVLKLTGSALSNVTPLDSSNPIGFMVNALATTYIPPPSIFEGIYIAIPTTVDQSNRPIGTPYSNIYRWGAGPGTSGQANNGWYEFGVTGIIGPVGGINHAPSLNVYDMAPIFITGIGITLGIAGDAMYGSDYIYYDPALPNTAVTFRSGGIIFDPVVTSTNAVHVAPISCPEVGVLLGHNGNFANSTYSQPGLIVLDEFSAINTTLTPAGGVNSTVWDSLFSNNCTVNCVKILCCTPMGGAGGAVCDLLLPEDCLAVGGTEVGTCTDCTLINCCHLDGTCDSRLLSSCVEIGGHIEQDCASCVPSPNIFPCCTTTHSFPDCSFSTQADCIAGGGQVITDCTINIHDNVPGNIGCSIGACELNSTASLVIEGAMICSPVGGNVFCPPDPPQPIQFTSGYFLDGIMDAIPIGGGGGSSPDRCLFQLFAPDLPISPPSNCIQGPCTIIRPHSFIDLVLVKSPTVNTLTVTAHIEVVQVITVPQCCAGENAGFGSTCETYMPRFFAGGRSFAEKTVTLTDQAAMNFLMYGASISMDITDQVGTECTDAPNPPPGAILAEVKIAPGASVVNLVVTLIPPPP